MNDCSWMYWVSHEGLHMMDRYNEVEGFINYILSNMRNIIGDDIKCSCKRCTKKSQSRCWNDSFH